MRVFMLSLALATAAACWMIVGRAPGAAGGASMSVVTTAYLPTGQVAYNGEYPFAGSAAASWNIPLGSIFRFADGREVIVTDRGRLGSEGWLDIFVWSWSEVREVEAAYGFRATVEIVRWGW